MPPRPQPARSHPRETARALRLRPRIPGSPLRWGAGATATDGRRKRFARGAGAGARSSGGQSAALIRPRSLVRVQARPPTGRGDGEQTTGARTAVAFPLTPRTGGRSLAGRAPPLHGGGPGFDSPRLHRGPPARGRFLLLRLRAGNSTLTSERAGPTTAPRPWGGRGAPPRQRHHTHHEARAHANERDGSSRIDRRGPRGRRLAGLRWAPLVGSRRERGAGGGRGAMPRRRAHGGCLGVGGRGRTRPRGETPRGGAGSLRSGGVRMGQPGRGDTRSPSLRRGAPGELKHLSTRRKREDSPSSGERTGRSPNPGGARARWRCRPGVGRGHRRGQRTLRFCATRSRTSLERVAGAGESPVGDAGRAEVGVLREYRPTRGIGREAGRTTAQG